MALTVVERPEPLRPSRRDDLALVAPPGRRRAARGSCRRRRGASLSFEQHRHGPPTCASATDRAQVGLLHARIGAHRLGRVEGDHLAVDQHGDLVGQAEHHAHVVLDRQQRLAHGDLADQLDEAGGLAVAHAGGRLVEQDHVGAAGDRDADLERALLGIGQVHRQHVALGARA